MSRKIVTLFVLLVVLLAACDESTAKQELVQQETGQQALLNNQPIPDLGGWSFERHVVIETYQARNRTVATYTYTMTMDGSIIEVCASVGYPIPFATQLTNPWRPYYYGSGGSSGAVVGNPEPNGLYSPESAEATYVNCVNEDGSVTPTYWEPRMFALPYRIESDRQLARLTEPTFTVQTGR